MKGLKAKRDEDPRGEGSPATSSGSVRPGWIRLAQVFDTTNVVSSASITSGRSAHGPSAISTKGGPPRPASSGLGARPALGEGADAVCASGPGVLDAEGTGGQPIIQSPAPSQSEARMMGT